MDFSDIISGVQQAIYSSDSQLIAVTNGTKILVKTVEDFQTIQIFDFKDIITQFEFSPDSSLISVVLGKKSLAYVFHIQDGKQICNIQDEGCGLIYTRWAPNSRSIIAFSDYQIKATIYSLTDKQQFCIKNPKYGDKGLSFSRDGQFMALAERREAKDFIGIYFTNDWKLINHFQVETLDLVDIEWSSNNSFILVWDSPLNYKLLAYCPAKGKKAQISPYEYALGIKSVAVSDNSTFVAVGSYDEKIRIVNTLTWRIVTELLHNPNLKSYSKQPTIYNESIPNQHSIVGNRESSYYNNVDNCKIISLKVSTTKPDQPQGIESVAWSMDNKFLASKSSNMPNTIWIWDITSLELKFVLNHLHPVKSFSWNTNSLHLVICTGKNQIFFFSPDGASVCDLPFEGKPLSVKNVIWAKDSRSMVLLDAADAILGYPSKDIFFPDEHDHTHEQ